MLQNVCKIFKQKRLIHKTNIVFMMYTMCYSFFFKHETDYRMSFVSKHKSQYLQQNTSFLSRNYFDQWRTCVSNLFNEARGNKLCYLSKNEKKNTLLYKTLFSLPYFLFLFIFFNFLFFFFCLKQLFCFSLKMKKNLSIRIWITCDDSEYIDFAISVKNIYVGKL